MAPILPASKFRAAAGRAASTVLPDEVSETLPIATKVEGELRVLVLFYKVLGRRGATRVELPSHAMHLDPRTGVVLRFWACDPTELGLSTPLAQVPGAGALPDDVTDFLDLRDRFFDISPTVWEAFEAGGSQVSAPTRDLVHEYFDLFLRITRPSVAPFYAGAARDFFDWIRAVLGAP